MKTNGQQDNSRFWPRRLFRCWKTSNLVSRALSQRELSFKPWPHRARISQRKFALVFCNPQKTEREFECAMPLVWPHHEKSPMHQNAMRIGVAGALFSLPLHSRMIKIKRFTIFEHQNRLCLGNDEVQISALFHFLVHTFFFSHQVQFQERVIRILPQHLSGSFRQKKTQQGKFWAELSFNKLVCKFFSAFYTGVC